MRRLIILILLFLPGICLCQKNDFVFSLIPTIRESFLGINLKQDGNLEIQSIIQIDSNGNFKTVFIVDTASVLPYNQRYNWKNNSRIVNDSTLIYESFSDSSIYYFNFKSGIRKKMLKGFSIGAFTNDGNYISVWPLQRFNKERRIYHFNSDGTLNLTGSTTDFKVVANPIGRDKFLLYNGMRNNQTCYDIFNPDFSIFAYSDDNFPFLSFINKSVGIKNFDIVMQLHHPYNSNIVWNYNLLTAKIDTIFSTKHITNVFPFPIENFFLLFGFMEDKGYGDEMNRMIREDKSDYISPTGYWMIGNSKTQKFRKVGYKEYLPTISSSGRHILFYKQKGDNFDVKLVSVKELLDGM